MLHKIFTTVYIVIAALALNGCKGGNQKALSQLILSPQTTQMEFAAAIRKNGLQQIGIVNQFYSFNYVIKYNWNTYGDCYAFYAFNGNGKLLRAKYYWGDSAIVFNKALGKSGYNKESRPFNKERYKAFNELYNDLYLAVNAQPGKCDVRKEVSMLTKSCDNANLLSLRNRQFLFKNYFSSINLDYCNDYESMVIWEIDYNYEEIPCEQHK